MYEEPIIITISTNDGGDETNLICPFGFVDDCIQCNIYCTNSTSYSALCAFPFCGAGFSSGGV